MTTKQTAHTPTITELCDGHAKVGTVYMSGPIASDIAKAAKSYAAHDELEAALKLIVSVVGADANRVMREYARAALAKAGAA